MRWHIRWIRLSLLFLCVAVYLCPISARAAPTFSLTVSCWVEDRPQADRSFDLYQIGTIDINERVIYDTDFLDPSFPSHLRDNQEYVDFARILSDFVFRQGVSADATMTTDGVGNVCFTGLSSGLYLILGQSYTDTDGLHKISFEPMLLSIFEDQVVEAKHHVDKIEIPTSPQPDPPTVPNRPSVPVTPSDPKLPQTGILKWPVLVLGSLSVLCWLIFFVSGFCGRKRRIWILAVSGLFFGASLSFYLYNKHQDYQTARGMTQICSHLNDMPVDMRPTGESEEDPDLDLVRVYDGQAYLGMLTIPELDLTLPVNQRWNYPALETSPCRYAGSPSTNDFVICAHNYSSHFGKIGSLATGSDILFTDVMSNVYQYEVKKTEILKPYDVASMVSSDYDLTLFTCTYGGWSRITVRCQLVTNPAMDES